MTAPGGIVDPQLTAFFARDPARFLDGHPAVPEPEHRDHRKALALAIAAATLVALKIVRDRLAARHESVTSAHDAAKDEWRRQAPNWLMAVLPAIRQLYSLGRMGEGLTGPELDAVAADYAHAVGDYIGDTSAEALVAGLQIQLNNRWDEKLAWQRAAAAYGLDKRDMRTYLLKAANGSLTSADQLISPIARTFIDKALLLRCDLLGRSESWTALETGKALSWMYQQRMGRLPGNAMREWDTAEDESTCVICAPLDKTQAPLQQPFEINGHKLWAPQAHPGCRCHVRLVVPGAAPAQIEKSNKNHDKLGRFAERPGPRKVKATAKVKEATVADPAVAEMLRQAAALTPEKVAEKVGAEEDLRDLLPDNPRDLIPDNPRDLLPENLHDLLPDNPRDYLPNSTVSLDMLAPGTTDMLAAGTTDMLPGMSSMSAAQARGALHLYNNKVRRTVIKVPPAPKEPRTYGVYVSADSFNHVMNRVYGHEYWVGEDVDFSIQHAAGQQLVAKEHIDWLALRPNQLWRKRGMKTNDPERANIEAHWRIAAREAHAVFHRVISHPARGVMPNDGLTDEELRKVAELGGLTGQGYDLDTPQIRTAIISNCAELNSRRDADTSLAQAYGDYVTWHHPEWYGEHGQNLAAMLDAARDFQQSWPFTRATYDQVFFFDRVRRADYKDGVVTPTGHYFVKQCDYKSSLMDLGSGPPPLHMGLQILHLTPYIGGGQLRADNYESETIKLNQ